MEAPRYIPHYTTADYERWEGDWELWLGIPVSMSPSPSFRHQRVGARLISQLLQAIDGNDACRCRVVYETDWRVSLDTVVRPDVAVCCPEPSGDFITSPPKLIAEILSEVTAEKDRDAKRRLYEQQGVRTYLMLDPRAESFEALTLAGDRYKSLEHDGQAAGVPIDDGCRVTLQIPGLWI